MNEHNNWYGKPYYSLDAYFKNRYGKKCYKIAVDAGFTCPNRDGRLDNKGCIFCSAGGSGEFAVKMREYSVTEQIRKSLEKMNKETGDGYVIYFQAYTNTYGSIGYLKKIYVEALETEGVIGISIATRPDCLDDAVLRLLAELNRIYRARGKFLWVELGLQTIHPQTADYINRHYELGIYEKAIADLQNIDIPYITHIILGLPGETEKMMLETVRYVSNQQAKPFGVKLQLLHVLKNTALAVDYENDMFDVMTMESYIDLVAKCLQNIDRDIVIHRLTGDGPKSLLVAPIWSANKKKVLNALHHRLKELGVSQGQVINYD